MHELFVILDFLSRALALLVTIGGILGFVFRRWISSWIDAHFKRQVDTEIEILKNQLSGTLEEKKTALAKTLAKETEDLKAELARDSERNKRELDEEFRRKSRLFDMKSSFYETFQLEYSAVIVELYSHQALKESAGMQDSLGVAFTAAIVSRAHSMLMQANQKLTMHEAYVDPRFGLRIAELFRDLSKFMADGATDKKRLDELALEKGKISAELRIELMGG